MVAFFSTNPIDFTNSLPENTHVCMTMKTGEQISGSVNKAQGFSYIKSINGNFALIPGTDDFSLITDITVIENPIIPDKFGPWAVELPQTRNDYEKALFYIAGLINEISVKIRKDGFMHPEFRINFRRKMQLDEQFEQLADQIQLAKSKRLYIRHGDVIRAKVNGTPLPRPADLPDLGPLDQQLFIPPKPTDFDPDPAIRRKRSEKPIEALDRLSEIENSLSRAIFELGKKKIRPQRKAQLERIIAKRERQLKNREYVEAREAALR